MTRRWFVVLFACAVVASLSGATAGTTGEKAGDAATYLCTHCKVGADKAGKCPLCNKDMMKAGTYICSACDTTSETAGKCPCGKDYVKAELAGKKCGGCGYFMAKDAQGCAVCKAKGVKKS